MKAKVYFSREITPEKVLELYKMLGKELPGKVAVKVQEIRQKSIWRPWRSMDFRKFSRLILWMQMARTWSLRFQMD